MQFDSEAAAAKRRLIDGLIRRVAQPVNVTMNHM